MVLQAQELSWLGVSAAAVMHFDIARNVFTITPEPPAVAMKLIDRLSLHPRTARPGLSRMAYLRAVRDAMLDISDWSQSPDAPVSAAKKQQWVQFRQALRDLPAAYSGSGPIPWPEIPTA